MTTLITGLRAERDPHGFLVTDRYALRDIDRESGPDIMLFTSEAARQRVLDGESPFIPNLNSGAHGGNWVTPPVWDEPTEPADSYARIEAGASVLSDTVPRRELERANERLEQMRAERDAALAPITDVKDERLSGIWDMAARTADREGFCPEYERLTEAMGIPGRERNYRGVVTMRFNVYSYARERGPEAAGEQMREQMREAIRNLPTGSDPGEFSHIDIDDVEVEDVQAYR